MEERIEQKLDDFINYILEKPVEELTLDDYTILSAEVRDIRFRKSQADNTERMARIIAAMGTAGNPGNIPA